MGLALALVLARTGEGRWDRLFRTAPTPGS